MQKSISVENAKKAKATAVLTGFGLTVTDNTQDNVLVVEGNQAQWELFDGANAAAAQAGSAQDAWDSLKFFGGIAKDYGIKALKGAGSSARGVIGFLGSDVTKQTLVEGVHVATKATTVVGEVVATTGVAAVNTLCDETKAAYGRIKNDENYIGLKNKVCGLFTPKKVSGLW